MNHKKIYDLIIEKANSENRVKHQGVYYEKHHIIPKCLNGTNNKENLVLLTAKEHFICHKLLLFIYSFNNSVILAFHRMTHSGNGDYIISAKDYEYSRVLLSELLKKRIPWNKGKKNCFSEETLIKIGKVWKGRKHTEESKQKQRKSKLGEKNPFYGKISPNRGKHYSFTEEQIKNLSKSMKGKSPKVNSIKKECEYCHKIFTLPCYHHWHGEHCKIKNQINIL